MSLASKGARRTAALNFVEKDLNLGELMESLDGVTEKFGVEAENLWQAQSNYDDAKANLEERKMEIVLEVTSACIAEDAKSSQARIDRAILAAQEEDESYVQYRQEVNSTKSALEEAKSSYEVCRHEHRTLVTKLNTITATLNYLAASKQAATVAAGQLAGL